MSNGIEAGLEIRGTEAVPPTTWLPVVPSVDIDEVPNRSLFALLAGYPSRLGLEPGLRLRGLPSDLTRPIHERYNAWGGSAFDASWVNYEELVAAVQRMAAAVNEVAQRRGFATEDNSRLHRGVSIDAVIAFLGVYHARGFATRMIFWFTPI
jgi:hypothetical protein